MKLVHDMLVTKNIKDLFQVFVDNNLTELSNNPHVGRNYIFKDSSNQHGVYSI